MRLSASVLFITAFAGAAWVAAQGAADTPRPDPALKRLDYFIGTWHTEGKMKESIFGPADTSSGTDRHEWAVSGFFEVLHHEETFGANRRTALKIVGYDPEKKVYRGYTFSDQGGMRQSEGTFSAGTWIWEGVSYDVNGEHIETRSVIKPIAAKS